MTTLTSAFVRELAAGLGISYLKVYSEKRVGGKRRVKLYGVRLKPAKNSRKLPSPKGRYNVFLREVLKAGAVSAEFLPASPWGRVPSLAVVINEVDAPMTPAPNKPKAPKAKPMAEALKAKKPSALKKPTSKEVEAAILKRAVSDIEALVTGRDSIHNDVALLRLEVTSVFLKYQADIQKAKAAQ